MRALAVIFFLFFLLTVAALRADDSMIWVEGEDAVSTNIKPHPWYSEQVDKSQLSGGAFLSNFSTEEGHADYTFKAPQAGAYTFWIRANPIAAPLLDYQLNGGPWTPVDFGHPTDVTNIARDGKPDMRFVAWIKVGTVTLQADENKLTFRFHSPNNNHGSIDCFVLTQGSFIPNGKTKPGERLGSNEPGWWAFEPPPETFSPDAELDLRSLNENEAGESGFIQAKSDVFTLGNGQPVRFWGVNVNTPPANASNESLDFLAARLAKLGHNLVRIQTAIYDRTGGDPTKIDTARLDRVFYLIEALKKKGIYVDLSNYFVLGMQLKASDGIPGTDDVLGGTGFGLLIFEPKMQEIYKAWLKQILTTKSPYSGKTLAEEPSVAICEIQNEDSLFFWTFNFAKLGEGPRKIFEEQFATYLAAQYGSLAAAFAAWPGEKLPDDSVPDNRAGFYGAYDMSDGGFNQASPEKQKRIVQQINFMASVQKQFYSNMGEYFRKDLRAKWPIAASNWITVPGLGFLERTTYTAADVIDKHGYFGGKHEGEGAGYSVRAGHRYEDKSALLDPESLPFQYVRLPGHPHIQSELAWNKPNRFIAEGELLTSAYESLQGVDGVFFFAADNGNWEHSGGGNWTYLMPGEIGQSPACALQYRRGDLQAGAVVRSDVATADDLLARRGCGLVEGRNADFRATEVPATGTSFQANSFDPLSFFVGRVARSFNGDPIALDLGKYIDRANKKIASTTGELNFDYGQGLFTVSTPRSQAVTGFLAKAGPIRLADVTIDAHNEYGTVHVISLDGQPLATSKKILVQAFTEEKMTGFKAENGTIKDIGHAPILVKDIDVGVSFPQIAHLKAIVLDEQGYRRREIKVDEDGGGCSLVLPKDTLYTILTR